MKSILEPYIGKEIGINIERPLRIDSAILKNARDDCFAIVDENKGYTHYFPYSSIVQVMEHPDGIDIGGLFEHTKHFVLVIKVSHIPEITPI